MLTTLGGLHDRAAKRDSYTSNTSGLHNIAVSGLHTAYNTWWSPQQCRERAPYTLTTLGGLHNRAAKRDLYTSNTSGLRNRAAKRAP
jgi:hypothetical protein